MTCCPNATKIRGWGLYIYYRSAPEVKDIPTREGKAYLIVGSHNGGGGGEDLN